jgi:hypothetical protein
MNGKDYGWPRRRTNASYSIRSSYKTNYGRRTNWYVSFATATLRQIFIWWRDAPILNLFGEGCKIGWHRIAGATKKWLPQIQIMVEQHADSTPTGCTRKGAKSHIYDMEHLEGKVLKSVRQQRNDGRTTTSSHQAGCRTIEECVAALRDGLYGC